MRTVAKMIVYPTATVGVLMLAVSVADKVSQRRRYARAAPAREAAKTASGVAREVEQDATGRQVPVDGVAVARRDGLCESFLGLPLDTAGETAVEQMASAHELEQLRTALTVALTGIAPILPPPGGYSRLDRLDGLGSRQ